MVGDTDLTSRDLGGGGFDGGSGSELDGGLGSGSQVELAQILDVPVTISAILGHARVPVGDLLKIAPGAVFELDRRTGEAVDILINDRLVARGEVVLVDDRLGVTMTEIVRPAV